MTIKKRLDIFSKNFEKDIHKEYEDYLLEQAREKHYDKKAYIDKEYVWEDLE